MATASRKIEPAQFGRTVSDALELLPKANAALIAVRVTEGTVTYLAIDPAAIIAGLGCVNPSGHELTDPMPCEWHAERGELVIGSHAAIMKAGTR